MRFPEFSGEWEVKKLGEIGEIINGLTYSPKDINENGILVLRSSNVQDRILTFNDNVFVNTNSFNAVLENDILICVRNGSKNLIGKNAIIKKEQEGIGFGAFMTVYRSPFNNFLFQWFDTNSYKEEVYKNLGATINSINGSDLKKFLVPFPCLKEQQNIATFLSLIDERIQAQSKIIENLKTLIKGTSEKIFAQKLKFKDDKGIDFPDWEVKKLGDILTIGSGRDYKHLEKGDIPVFGTGGLMTYVNSFLYEGETVCIGRKGTIDKPMYFKGKIWTVDTLFYSHSFLNTAAKFIFYIFKMINWKEYNEASGVPSLSKSTIEKIEINIPSLPEQIKIAKFLSQIDEKIAIEQQLLTQYENQKKYLLQNLFI